MDLLPALFLRLRCMHVRLAHLPGDLGVQLLVAPPPFRIEISIRNRRLNRATVLGAMRAIPETAPLRQDRDIGEGRVQTVRSGPQLQLAHTRRIDEGTAGWLAIPDFYIPGSAALSDVFET